MEGTKDADAIYTDVWVSMGEPMEKWAERINYLRKYQVNQSVIDNAKDDCIFLHCLPSFHDQNTTIGKEIYENLVFLKWKLQTKYLMVHIQEFLRKQKIECIQLKQLFMLP